MLPNLINVNVVEVSFVKITHTIILKPPIREEGGVSQLLILVYREDIKGTDPDSVLS